MNSVDKFVGSAVLTVFGGGVAVAGGRMLYRYAAMNPVMPVRVADFVSSYFPGTAPAPTLAGGLGFGTSKIYESVAGE